MFHWCSASIVKAQTPEINYSVHAQITFNQIFTFESKSDILYLYRVLLFFSFFKEKPSLTKKY